MKRVYFILSITFMVLMVISLVGIYMASNIMPYMIMFNIVSIVGIFSVYKYEKIKRISIQNLVD